jgi:hypothetical protein
MLLELTSDYMRFLSLETLTTKRQLLKEMNSMLQDMGETPSKRIVKKIYQDIFKKQLELIITSDPKKPEKLEAAKI